MLIKLQKPDLTESPWKYCFIDDATFVVSIGNDMLLCAKVDFCMEQGQIESLRIDSMFTVYDPDCLIENDYNFIEHKLIEDIQYQAEYGEYAGKLFIIPASSFPREQIERLFMLNITYEVIMAMD